VRNLPVKMKDYNLSIKVRNNWMLSAMRREGVKTAAQLSRISGVSQMTISRLLNLKDPALSRRTGQWTRAFLKIASALKTDPANLVPPQHLLDSLDRNAGEVEVSEQEMISLSSPEAARMLSGESGDGDMTVLSIDMERYIDQLSDKEQEIIRRSYGIGGAQETLAEIADDYGVSRERIRQLRDNAQSFLKCLMRGLGIKAARARTEIQLMDKRFLAKHQAELLRIRA
jgi:RNA polymerase sigma factor (sigma-70 family)